MKTHLVKYSSVFTENKLILYIFRLMTCVN